MASTRLRGDAALALAIFVLGRALVWLRWLASDRTPGDVEYYFTSTQALPTQGIATTLVEYPVPVVWMLGIPQLLAPGDRDLHLVLFALLMLAADAAFTWTLWRRAPRPLLAVSVWSAFLVSMGTITYLRFDMVPAALVGMAVLLSQTRPRLSGALVATGAAIKLWPAAVAAPLLAGTRSRVRRLFLLGFVVAGGSLALASLLLTGWERTTSALTWQSERGLQIESIWATPMMLARVMGGEQQVVMSHFKAFEVTGPGLEQWMAASTVASFAAILVMGLLLWRGHRMLASADEATRLSWMAWAVSALTALVIVTNKTLSPQYVVWLGAPMVVAIASENSPIRRWILAALCVAIGAGTQAVYPIWYVPLWAGTADDPATLTATWILTARNVVLLIGALWLTCGTWFRSTFRARYAGSRVREIG